MGTATQQSEANIPQDMCYQHELSPRTIQRGGITHTPPAPHAPHSKQHDTQHTQHTQRRANVQVLEIAEIAEGLDASSELVVVKVPVCALDTGWGQTGIWRVKGKATEDLHFQINLNKNILYF